MTQIRLFRFGCGYYPHLWKYPRSVETIRISQIYPYFVGIIRIGHNMSYLAQNVSHVLQSFILVVDIIYISHTTIYLARNDCPIFYIYSSSESDWCIPSFPVCNLIYFSVPSSFYLVSLVSEYKLSPNHIQIYVHTFITSIEASFYFSHDFPICALYLCVV